MVDASSPYTGARIALGTMHAKERALAKPFARILGAELVVPHDIDTDAYGTFTGEIARAGTMLDAARAKARLSMVRTGLKFGLASEGSYGAHPYVPFIPDGTEVVLFIDDERGIEIRESIVVTRTNYDSQTLAPGDDVEAALHRMRFPSHAVTVRPNQLPDKQSFSRQSSALPAVRSKPPLFKGLRELGSVAQAVGACAAASPDGKALIAPDMRAHCNPTRMAVIRKAATKLAKRIACLCPACKTPGFGIVDVVRGLPCPDCGAPTQLAVAEIHRCAACSVETRKPLRRDDERASPGQCQLCNP